MEIVLGILAVLVLLILAATAVGARLPVAHRASHSADLAQSPERVWEAIADPASGRAGSTFAVVESEPPRRLVRKVVGERAFGGSWTYEIAPRDGGATLTITEDGEIYNPFFRFVSKVVLGHARTIEGYLADLRRTLDESASG